MEVCSPKDGFVTSLMVTSGQSVSKGEPLVQMDTLDEDQDAKKLDKLQTIRKLMAAQYEGEELKIARRLATLRVEIAKHIEGTKKILSERYNLAASKGIFGTQTANGDPKGAPATTDGDRFTTIINTDYPNAVLDREKAELDLQKFEFAVARHLAVNDAVETYIQAQITTLDTKRKMLTVVAPIGGKVRLKVGVNSFAELGNVLLELE